MNKLLLILLFVLFVSDFIRPQQGAYIAPIIKFSAINGQGANLIGVKGGWIINNTFVIGAEYYALNSNISSNWIDPSLGFEPTIKFTTGGLNFEYVFIHKDLLSVSAELFMGGAGLNLKPSTFYGGDFLVWEPQLNANINLKDWLHLSLGISYRTTSELDNYHIDGSGIYPPLDLSIKEFRGWTSSISILFGMY